MVICYSRGVPDVWGVRGVGARYVDSGMDVDIYIYMCMFYTAPRQMQTRHNCKFRSQTDNGNITSKCRKRKMPTS